MLSTAKPDKFEANKLDRTNYLASKFKMQMLLTHKVLCEVIEGTDSANTNAKKEFALIGLSLKDSEIVHIQSCTTGNEAWMNLYQLYENSGAANKMHLLKELMTAKTTYRYKVLTHIAMLRSIVGNLGKIGTVVTNEQYKNALLRSLPKSYESLVVTLENLIDRLSFEDILARIIREEFRQVKSDGRIDAEFGE